MKKYNAPVTKVLSINVNNGIMTDPINIVSGYVDEGEPIGDEPLF